MAVHISGLTEAIVGTMPLPSGKYSIVYDLGKVITAKQQEGMTEDEAKEWVALLISNETDETPRFVQMDTQLAEQIRSAITGRLN